MDERKSKIKELEDKKRADTEARNRILEGLGEALFQKIGESEPFLEKTGNTPGGVLAEFRGLKREIAESAEIIKSLNADIQRLRELEEQISAREEEFSGFDKELEGDQIILGKALLGNPNFDSSAGLSKEQEGKLLNKINEQESRLEELKEKDGGILSWLGKSAQMALAKTLLQKNRAALEKFYHSAGEKYLGSVDQEMLEGDAAASAARALELTERLADLAADLTALRAERRKIGDIFGTEGSPSRRIQGLEKHIAHVRGEFSGVYLGMGMLASASEAGDALSPYLVDEDPVLERAKLINFRIAEEDFEIEKIKASISIDDEKEEIEKIKKAILGQRQKIADAESEIESFHARITDIENHIDELGAFINGGAKENHGKN